MGRIILSKPSFRFLEPAFEELDGVDIAPLLLLQLPKDCVLLGQLPLGVAGLSAQLVDLAAHLLDLCPDLVELPELALVVGVLGGQGQLGFELGDSGVLLLEGQLLAAELLL